MPVASAPTVSPSWRRGGRMVVTRRRHAGTRKTGSPQSAPGPAIPSRRRGTKASDPGRSRPKPGAYIGRTENSRPAPTSRTLSLHNLGTLWISPLLSDGRPWPRFNQAPDRLGDYAAVRQMLEHVRQDTSAMRELDVFPLTVSNQWRAIRRYAPANGSSLLIISAILSKASETSAATYSSS